MSESTESKSPGMDPRVLGVWAAIAIVIFALLWLMFSFRALSGELAQQKDAHAVALKAEQEAAAAALDADRRAGTARLAEGMGTVFAPLILNNPDGGATLKLVCESLASSRTVELVIVTDTDGKVLATSNASFADRSFPEMSSQGTAEVKEDDGWLVTRPVTFNNNRIGAIRIKVKY